MAEYLGLPVPLLDRLRRKSLVRGRASRGRWTFDRTEVDRQIDLGMSDWPQTDLHAVARFQSCSELSLGAALRAGGVLLNATVQNYQDALVHGVTALQGLSEDDRKALLAQLLAREDLGSTALANGFAIPHTTRAGPRIVPRSVIALVRTNRPIPFGPDPRGLTDVVVVLVAGSPSEHLALLARITALVKAPMMGPALRLAVTSTEVIDLFERFEKTLLQDSLASDR